MVSKYKYHIILFVIIAISFLVKLYYVEKYSTFTDELISALVAKSIGENGIPILPSNALYTRALLHHYLLSVPINLFGLSYFSMRINSIIFSLLTILVVYLLGVKSANRKVAIAAALLLSLNSIFNQYSLAGRMYMTYGCFYVLSIYFFHRGFIYGKSASKILSICFMAATMLSSKAGLIIGPIFAFLIFIYNRENWYKDRVIIFGAATWMLLAYFIHKFKIPGAIAPFTTFAGSPPGDFISLKWSGYSLIHSITYLWRILDGCIPFSVSFFIVMTFLVAIKGKLKDHYSLVALLPALVIQSLFLHIIVQKRVTISITPLYILACCQLFYTLWNWINADLKKKGSFKKSIAGNAKTVTLSTMAFIFISVPFSIDRILTKYPEFPIYLIHPIYDHRSRINPQPAYLFVRQHAKKNDIVIQTTLEYGYFFLGEDYNYYFLRQKKAGRDANGNRIYKPFSKNNEPYYGRPIIDDLEELKNLVKDSKHGKIWFVLGEKSKWAVGQEIKEFIKGHFQLKFSNNNFEVYLVD